MGKIDTITRNYLRRPEIFADVFNKFLYHGRQSVAPEKLVELDTAEIAVPYGADNVSVPEQRYRDAAKTLMAKTDGKAAYCILAVESEAKINYAMPVKDGLYDFLHLAKQVTEAANSHRKSKSDDNRPTADEFLSGFWKNDRLLPVVTVVIYFGAEEWDGPLSLKEMYAGCEEEILKYSADYRINLIAPNILSDKEIDEFQTNLREIMKYIKYSSDGRNLKEIVSTDERFKNVEREAVDVINAVTGSKVKYQEGKENIDMCLAIQEIREEGREEGRLEGEIYTYKKLGVSQQDARKYIMEEYQKSEDEAEKLIKMYWK